MPFMGGVRAEVTFSPSLMETSSLLGMGQAEVTPVEAGASVTRLPHGPCRNGFIRRGPRCGCVGTESGRWSRKPATFRGW